MPELPEVEVTRRSIADRMAGDTVLGVRLGKALRWPFGQDTQTICGLTILAVRRRGKYILVDLSDGWILLIHLGMSGSLKYAQLPAPPGVHDHFDLVLARGTLRLHDPRRFGAVILAHGEQSPVATRLLGRLGVEPLGEGFSAADFWRELKRRRGAIKQVLLSGDVVVGVGNIYASEALFQAGIRPTVQASRISRMRAARLREAIRDVLTRAVESGGSTLRNFTDAEGTAGHFQTDAMVYGRSGEPCRRCGSTILQIRQGQRSTFFCKVCQRP